MKRCNFCKLNIIDNAASCPLCGGVLEGSDSDYNTYPNVVKKTKALKLIFKICLFLALLTSTICVGINFSVNPSIKWSYIVVGIYIYTLLLLYLFLKEGAGYRIRTFLGVIGGLLLLVLIDYVFGFTRWSLNFMLPISILVIDIDLIFLMIFNRRNWQSYVLLIGAMVFFSIVPIIFYYMEIISNPYLSQFTFLFTLFVFIGIMIFGGPRVSHELKRRFYIK